MSAGRELNLEEIHEKICELMVFFHDFCEKHHLRYYLSYGSLIGAIRHKGFIPWDDDFDVQMPREDFLNFLEMFEKEYGSSRIYKVCTRANTSNYYFGIPRLCDQRFKYVTQIEALEPFEQGIFIDIYPLDNYGNTLEEAGRLKKQARMINRDFTIYVNRRSASSKWKTPFKMITHKLLHMKYGDCFPQKVDRMIYDKIKSQTSDKDRYIGVICWEQKVVAYEREWFAKRILVDFEKYQFWVPEKYDEILKKSYGNYMELPPEDQRVMTHNYKIYEKTESEYAG